MSDKYLDFLVVHLVFQVDAKNQSLKAKLAGRAPRSGFDFLGLIPQKDAGHFFRSVPLNCLRDSHN